MKKKMMFLSLVLCFTIMFCMIPIGTFTVSAVYNVNSAVSYANTYWNDGVGLCAEFVSRCLSQGGISIPNYSYYSYNTQSYKNNSGILESRTNPYTCSAALLLYLSESGYKIIESPSNSDISVGDVVFMKSSSGYKDGHVGICISNNGTAIYAAHNKATNSGKFYSDYPCTYVAKINESSGNTENYANLGDDFYGVILNTKCWKPISQVEGTKRIYLESEDNSSMQKWHFVRQNDGAYVISSCYNGNILEMSSGTREVCTQITAPHNDFWGGAYQQWYLIPQGNGYIFLNKHYKNEKWVMDLHGANSSDGSVIQINNRNNSVAQIWTVYTGDDVQLKATSLKATVSSPTVTFTWQNMYGAKRYDVKIWKDEDCINDWYYTEWDAKNGFSMDFPNGTYYAYICTCDYFQCLGSSIVKFVVETKTHTISFSANGGTNAPLPQIKIHGKDLMLTSDIPKRDGYIFVGWANDSTATTAKYYPGGAYTIDHSTTLYAVWKINSGDGNSDGKIDAEDLIVLRKALLTYSEYSNVLDVNCDGVLDIRDLVKLKKWLASKT